MIADFEIIPGKEILEKFYDKRDFFFLSPQIVEKLRAGEDAYSKYLYGCWLYVTGAHNKENLRIVRDCYEFAAKNGIADALYMLSRLYYLGDYIDDEGITRLDRKLYDKLLRKAKLLGSELAKMQSIIERFYYRARLKKDVSYLIKQTKEMSQKPGASVLWLEQLAWFYENRGRLNDAIATYEECVDRGLKYSIFDLACNYYQRGNIAYYESLMEEGIEKEVPDCFALGFECEDDWDAYDDKTRDEIHKRLDVNLRRGVELGSKICTYYLTRCLYKGIMGFKEDNIEALRYARIGMDMGLSSCYDFALDIFFFHGKGNAVSPEMNMTEEEVLLTRLRAVRHAPFYEAWNVLSSHVLEFSKELKKMGYADELNYWRELYCYPEKEEDEEEDDDTVAVNPTVMVIQPSGFTDFIETETRSLSYMKLIELIDAEGCDAVHFSDPLNRIKEECGLKKKVVMYVNKNAMLEDLPDNPVATMLYGHAYEIRGAVVVALEDKKYNTHSFDTFEDAEAVFDAINEFTGNLLTSDTFPDDDGRNDPWA